MKKPQKQILFAVNNNGRHKEAWDGTVPTAIPLPGVPYEELSKSVLGDVAGSSTSREEADEVPDWQKG